MDQRIILTYQPLVSKQLLGLLSDLFPELDLQTVAHSSGWGSNVHSWGYGRNGNIEVIWEGCSCAYCDGAQRAKKRKGEK